MPFIDEQNSFGANFIDLSMFSVEQPTRSRLLRISRRNQPHCHPPTKSGMSGKKKIILQFCDNFTM
jgi:hypothetical protein